MRHDLRVWESASGKAPRLNDDGGALMLGDEILDDWRARTKTGMARVRAYYDVIPDRASELTLDATRKNAVGRSAAEARVPRRAGVGRRCAARRRTRSRRCSASMARPATARCSRTSVDNFQDHPAGGCRMGNDPATSVVDSWGRTHDHENLFVVGAPTCVSGELRERDADVLRAGACARRTRSRRGCSVHAESQDDTGASTRAS